MAPPRKLIHKSRGIGGKKKDPNAAPARRGRPPKNVPAPTAPANDSTFTSDSTSETATPAIATPPTSPATLTGPQKDNPKPALTTKTALPFTGLNQVNNTLLLPKFDPNAYFANDLFKDTSALDRTTKEAADDLVQSIEEKRQTVRVAVANIQLNQDVVKAGNEYLKLEGLAIDYATTGVNNETKFVNYQTAGVNKEIALNKFDQANERLTQGQATLAGMQSLTPLISQEWEQRRALKLSQISSLKIEATKAREALEPKMMQLSQNFKQELEELN